jgi:hypothetical protein
MLTTHQQIIKAIITTTTPRVRVILWDGNMIENIGELLIKDCLIANGKNVNAPVRHFISQLLFDQSLCKAPRISIEHVEEA